EVCDFGGVRQNEREHTPDIGGWGENFKRIWTLKRGDSKRGLGQPLKSRVFANTSARLRFFWVPCKGIVAELWTVGRRDKSPASVARATVGFLLGLIGADLLPGADRVLDLRQRNSGSSALGWR